MHGPHYEPFYKIDCFPLSIAATNVLNKRLGTRSKEVPVSRIPDIGYLKVHPAGFPASKKSTNPTLIALISTLQNIVLFVFSLMKVIGVLGDFKYEGL